MIFRIIFCCLIAILAHLSNLNANETNLPTASQTNTSEKSPTKYQQLGHSLITLYSSDDINTSNTNWFIQQHSNGVIFVSNTYGLFSFDGEKWRKHPITNDQSPEIRQFRIHTDGKIYIGGRSDFGFFSSTSNGDLQYQSLLTILPSEQQQFSDINNVFIFNKRIFFISPEQIMAYTPNGKIQVWTPESKFSRAWKTGNRLFFNDGLKLKYFENDEIFSVKQFDKLDISGYQFVQKIKRGYLIGTRSQGIYLLKENQLSVWLDKDRTEAKMLFYNSLQITPEIFAISTIHGGVLFFNQQAELVYKLNTNNGLPVNITLNLFLDDQQGLWLAQEGQLVRAQLPFSLSVFRSEQHSIAKIRNFARLNNQLYFSAVNGIMSIDNNSDIQRLKGAVESTGNILKFNNTLIIAGAKECQSINPKTGTKLSIYATPICRDILLSKKYPNTLFFITERSISFSKFIDHHWSTAIDLSVVNNISSALVEDSLGQIWSSNRNGELLKFWFENEAWQYKSIQLNGKENTPLVFNGDLLIATNEGLFHWDQQQETLARKVKWYHQFFGDKADPPYYLYQDNQQRLWISSSENTGYFTIINYKPTKWKNYPITASGLDRLNRVYIDENNKQITWLGFNNGIVRYQPDSQQQITNIQAHITELRLNNTDRSLFVNIFEAPKITSRFQLQSDTVRVYFSLTSFLQAQKNQYRYRLNNGKWSQWNTENYVDLGSLSGDDYQIEVQAKDHQNSIYTAKPLSFTVIPPWYKSLLAYILYIIIAITLLIFSTSAIVKLRTKALIIKQQELEQQVADRTATIQEQADQLKELDKAKSRFFTNVSHEFRTPLTLAIGPLQELLRSNRITDQKDQQHIEIALKNSQQMLSLVGQILDINRLESGEMRLVINQIPLANELQKILSRFQYLADKNNIILEQIGFDSNESIWFDYDHLNKIMTNLLSNALKFSPSKSKITIGLHFIQQQKIVKIWVQDRGVGIPDDERKHLFERFFQGKNSSNHLQPGTGIGLSMVKDLLELHQGNIQLIKQTIGCHFEITLKLGNNHYQTQDFADFQPIKTEFSSYANPEEEFFTNKIKPIAPKDEISDRQIATILVVDDNQDMRSFISSTLQNNYHIIQANNGQEALKVISIHQPDFIISDIMMPIMDGLQFTQKLKENQQTAHIPLLLLTAKSTKREIVEGLQHGADDYLSKPFDSSELIARIAAHLQQKKNIAKAIYQNFILENSTLAYEQTTQKKENFESQFKNLVLEKLSEPEFDIKSMADFLNMERSTLFRRVKKFFDCTPNQYLRTQRLNLSLRMLKQQSGTVSEIAYAVGFQSLNYFSRSFKNQFNVPPSDFQKI